MRIIKTHPLGPVLSVEVFPPKPDASPQQVRDAVARFGQLRPDFISVTYGAGGSTKGFTVDIADYIQNQQHIPALAHLTCVGESPATIDRVIQQMQARSLHSVLALRGDLPPGCDPNAHRPFMYAADLIAYLTDRYPDLEIGGAAYPEGHMDCPHLTDDLDHLKNKVDAGAQFLITQLFFNNDLFFRFLETARNHGISVPIFTGIMPVTGRRQIERILSLSRTSFPAKFRRILDRYDHNPAAMKEAGIAYATEQIIDLIASGVDGIHLYAMNKPELAEKIFGDIQSIRTCFQSPAT
jgi:methylenetetrahydrofolate reductase (NADPH)